MWNLRCDDEKVRVGKLEKLVGVLWLLKAFILFGY